ncbi:MAG TPA: HAD family hydrolase [Acidimicrobiaceae bacterium]|jgi:putative hydrolase of the HAD superfamily|nr:HAD family hydrolase [Acidimicrobiaceae bacterium]
MQTIRKPFDAVFFDFGGVITSSPFDAFAAYEERAGLASSTIRTINATNPDVNAWARLERNQLSLSQFIPEFEKEAAELGFQVDAREVLGCLSGSLRPTMVEFVQRCAAHYQVALLTNNVADHVMNSERDGEEVAQLLGCFSAVIESSKVGKRKPDPEFYELACTTLGVEPTRVVFLDDLGINLKPARAMGMTTIKVEDPAAAIRAASRLLFAD